ncbi:MAG: YceI family protein [Solirubrobacterales bacterium]
MSPDQVAVIGPGHGSILIRTTSEGVGKGLGHDLVLAVDRWEGRVAFDAVGAISVIELDADPAVSVEDSSGGAKALSDDDRLKIAAEAQRKVLGNEPIRFRSSSVGGSPESPAVDGDLTLAGESRAISVALEGVIPGELHASLPLKQSDWGISPYRALLGALRVADTVEVVVVASVSDG